MGKSDERSKPAERGAIEGEGFFDVARRMAQATTEAAADAVVATLRFATQVYGLERAYVRLLADDEAHYATTYEHHRPDVAPLSPAEVTVASMAWAHARLVRGDVVVFSSPSDLPPDASSFRAALERIGVHAALSVPVLDGPRLLGYVTYAAAEGRAWSSMEVDLLRLLGEMIAAVVVRTRADATVRGRIRFEEMLSAAARRFVGIPPEDVDAEIDRTLEQIAACLDVDRAMVMDLDVPREVLSVTHEWRGPAAPSVRALFERRVEELSPVVRRALASEALVGRAETADPGSATEAHLERTQAHAFVVAPLHVEGHVGGLMTLETLTHRRHAPEDEVLARVKLVADVIAAALSDRAARERVRRWERRFAQILDSAMDGVVLLDGAGVVSYWTAQATAVFGADRAQMVGSALASVIHEDDRPALAAKLATAAGPASSPERFELRGLHSDGHVVPVEVSMTRLERSEGCLVASFVRDITDRKRAEAEKQRAFDEVSRQKRTVEHERDYLREGQRTTLIVGESPAIREALAMLEAVADTASSVLLTGESGVGKEVFAAALHAQSGRSRGPFVKVNCASVPGSLFESEFFGHAKGSFTGAVRDRIGRFELADGGTLFLDEVGEIPLELQAKLLRVLQEGEFERVGEERTRRLDVRIVTATNRDLVQEVEAGRFRRDLYFRLGVFPIAIPPLRERGDDCILLARHFLERHAAEARRAGLTLSPDDEARLLAYDWPGNVRELDHVLQRAVILSRGPPLRLDLALPYRGTARATSPEVLREEDLRRLERENLVLALKRAGGRVSGAGGAAELLGIHPSTLRDRMKTLGIARPD